MLILLLSALCAHARKCAPLEYLVVARWVPGQLVSKVVVGVRGWKAEGLFVPGEVFLLRIPTNEREGQGSLPLVGGCPVRNVRKITVEWQGDLYEAPVTSIRSTLVVHDIVYRKLGEGRAGRAAPLRAG